MLNLVTSTMSKGEKKMKKCLFFFTIFLFNIIFISTSHADLYRVKTAYASMKETPDKFGETKKLIKRGADLLSVDSKNKGDFIYVTYLVEYDDGTSKKYQGYIHKSYLIRSAKYGDTLADPQLIDAFGLSYSSKGFSEDDDIISGVKGFSEDDDIISGVKGFSEDDGIISGAKGFSGSKEANKKKRKLTKKQKRYLHKKKLQQKRLRIKKGAAIFNAVKKEIYHYDYYKYGKGFRKYGRLGEYKLKPGEHPDKKPEKK